MRETGGEVTEFQGFYGPFTVPEKLLQKIWMRLDFDWNLARTEEGEEVEVFFPGRWNMLGGPDFRGARLRIGGKEVEGDVEVHFHAADWRRHQHDRDPAYDQVVLHILLFHPPPDGKAAQTFSGRILPQLVLLDLLHHDLEEYLAEDALTTSLERDHWQVTERLLLLPVEKRRELLQEHARKRWEQKVHFSKLRIERLGWSEACHQTALEILGYRRNRTGMLNVASRFRIGDWREAKPDEEALLQAGGAWQMQGARPANRPRQRLRQYLWWMERRPDWPDRVLKWVESQGGADDVGEGAAVLRRKWEMKSLRKMGCEELTGGVVEGSRLDTFLCDGLLPLAAAAGVEGLFGLWFAWYPGDFPDRVEQTLKVTEICDRRRFVRCNGFGQGVLSLSLDQREDPLACFEIEQS